MVQAKLNAKLRTYLMDLLPEKNQGKTIFLKASAVKELYNLNPIRQYGILGTAEISRQLQIMTKMGMIERVNLRPFHYGRKSTNDQK